ncbi:MAG TPA: hypothetical protein VGL98_10480 [Gammaproteobacteria bacterium]
MTYRALAILGVVLLGPVVADEAAAAEVPAACERGDLKCLQELRESECVQPASTLETCLVFLQRLETARRRSRSPGLALLLGNTLQGIARKDDVSPQAKERYLRRSRAAYRQVVKDEPFSASGYLGLAEVAETGEERVEWLRGAVHAEYRPAHMELLANALSTEVRGQAADLEAARVIEDAYTYELTNTEKWRYAVSALQRYTEAVERYPSATSERAVDNVLLRLKDDIDYPLLQQMLLNPEQHLAHLADAFAIMCEKNIVQIVEIDECMAGLELAVSTAEGPVTAGTRRMLAEATLVGMRTIAGESLTRSAQEQGRFVEWIDRLVMTGLEPVDVAASLLEAKADYTPDPKERTETLLAAIELSPNRGDLRLKLGTTYVRLEAWPEALEQLRVATLLLPLEEQEAIDKLVEKADEAYQARFFPPDVTPAAVIE